MGSSPHAQGVLPAKAVAAGASSTLGKRWLCAQVWLSLCCPSGLSLGCCNEVLGPAEEGSCWAWSRAAVQVMSCWGGGKRGRWEQEGTELPSYPQLKAQRISFEPQWEPEVLCSSLCGKPILCAEIQFRACTSFKCNEDFKIMTQSELSDG